jgi:hypothetical protein
VVCHFLILRRRKPGPFARIGRCETITRTGSLSRTKFCGAHGCGRRRERGSGELSAFHLARFAPVGGARRK